MYFYIHTIVFILYCMTHTCDTLNSVCCISPSVLPSTVSRNCVLLGHIKISPFSMSECVQAMGVIESSVEL